MEQRGTGRQCVVWAQGKHTHLMDGEPIPDATYDGAALPQMLRAGWRITNTVASQAGVYFVLTSGAPDDIG